MKVNYTITYQYMLNDGVGECLVILSKDDYIVPLYDCFSIDLKQEKRVDLGKSRDKIIEDCFRFRVSEKDIDLFLELLENNVKTLDAHSNIAHTFSHELTKTFDYIDKISVSLNAQGRNGRILVVCFKGGKRIHCFEGTVRKENEATNTNYGKWTTSLGYMCYNLPIIIDKIFEDEMFKLLAEMDERKEDIFSMNKEFMIQ